MSIENKKKKKKSGARKIDTGTRPLNQEQSSLHGRRRRRFFAPFPQLMSSFSTSSLPTPSDRLPSLIPHTLKLINSRVEERELEEAVAMQCDSYRGHKGEAKGNGYKNPLIKGYTSFVALSPRISSSKKNGELCQRGGQEGSRSRCG